MLGWAPSGLAPPTDDLVARVMNLYAHADPALARALQAGIDAEQMANRQGMDAIKAGGDIAEQMKKAAIGAARLMAADDGPRIAALATDGWDTHAGEGGATGRLAKLLGGLDGMFAAFESELGPRWKDTVVVAITEFGRTARSTAPSAPTTARARRRSSPAARWPAAASSPTGRACERPISTRAAT